MKDDREDRLSRFLAERRREPHPKLDAIGKAARERGVPIMQPETMSAVEQVIRLRKPKKILEIGTAVGYSAINMVLAANRGTHVVTLERDSEMVKEAERNIADLGLEELITVLERDALDDPSELSDFDSFDLIFIDAGKGHYKTFFNHYLNFLSADGVIVCDNILFRGYVVDPELAPKRLRKMTIRMREFNLWLDHHPDFTTVFLPVGDGLSISIKNMDV